MRFDVLLAQYLNQHKKLNLPGIGAFESDSSTVTWDENGKQKGAGNGIVFRNIPISKADDDLIAFISEHTGKMKPLAISDLESYLTLGKQFLYIGKPFYLEGIGTLQFAKTGNFEFTPGEFVATRLEEPAVEKAEERRKPYEEEERLAPAPRKGSGRAVLLWIILLIGLGLVGWGGYYYYTNYYVGNAAVNEAAPLDTAGNRQEDLTGGAGASGTPSSQTNQVDSTRPARSIVPVQESFYDKSLFKKFIVETTTDKQRALNRYRKLKSFGNDIELQTTDSVNFSLVFILPATDADTLRIKDSLNRWYYGNAKTNRVLVAP